jgi:hypothetical protein
MQNWESWKKPTEELPKLNTQVIVIPNDKCAIWVCPDHKAYLEKIFVNGKEDFAFFAYHDGGRYLVNVDKWRYRYDPDIKLFQKAKWDIFTYSASDTENKITTECQLYSAFELGLTFLSQKKEIEPRFENGFYSLGGEDWEIKIKELEE